MPTKEGTRPCAPAQAVPRGYVAALWVLLSLFVLRVVGQALVAFLDVKFLPPMEAWYSGLLPYRWLLPSQLLIIALYAKICVDFSRGGGFSVIPRRRLGQGVLVFAGLYLGVMIVRYAVRMSLYPQERWTGGSIPTFVHWVLAAFLLIFGTYHWLRTRGIEIETDRSPSAAWCRWAASFAAASLIIIGILSWIGYQLAPTLLAYHLGMRPAEFAVRIQRESTFTTLDGIPLVSDIYRPQRAQDAPTILVRMPYSKTPMNKLFATVIGRMWAERGYTVVLQGTRGRYDSGGNYYPLRHERKDGIETLKWIERQPWFNGRLGMWGGSYFGYTQWVLADQVEPGPSALMVQISSTDFHGMFYPGGAFSFESGLYWALGERGKQYKAPSQAMLQRGYDGISLIEADDRAVKDVSFFNDWVSHRERDQYWAEIDGHDRARTLEAPVYLMAGWFDPFLPTQLEDFINIRREARPEVAAASRLVVGPWAHARTVTFPNGMTPRNYRFESLAPSLAWFDQHLRSTGTDKEFPPVRIYVMGKNLWRDEQEWPLPGTCYVPFYLRSNGQANTSAGDGVLARDMPASQDLPDTYVYDPFRPVPTAGGAMIGPRAGIEHQNDIETRPDVLVYTTPTLEEELEVTGPVKLILYVSTTAPNTDFTGKLVDVHPDGSAYNVSDGIVRRSYGGPNAAAGADQPMEIWIDLWPTSMHFFKGHRIRLEVSSSNYPRFDRNLQTGTAGASKAGTRPNVAGQSIFHGSETPSRLILPIIPGKRTGEPIQQECPKRFMHH